MSVESIIRGLVRASTTVERRAEVSQENGSLFEIADAAPYQETTRQGQGWQGMDTAAIAGLVVRPSTVAHMTLFNGELAGGKSYVLDRAFAFRLVSTANGVAGLWLCSHPAGSPTKPSTNLITAIKSTRGKANYSGNAVLAFGQTVVDDGWFPWEDSFSVVTVTTPGGQKQVSVAGRIIVPPQAAVSLQVVADVVGATYTAGFAWYERQLDLP